MATSFRGIRILRENESQGLDDLGLAFESIEKKSEILECLADLFSQNTRDYWLKILRDSDLISTKVNTLVEASNDLNVLDNNYVTEIYHPRINENIKVHGTPWKFSETPSNPGIAPTLGEHNNDILESIGYESAEISDLKDRGVI